MNEIISRPIGIIRSPHDKTEGMTIQPAASREIRGSDEVFSDPMGGMQPQSINYQPENQMEGLISIFKTIE